MKLHSSIRCICGGHVAFWHDIQTNRYMKEDIVIEGKHSGTGNLQGRMIFYAESDLEVWELSRFMCARMAAALELTECGDWWKSLSEQIDKRR